MGWEIVCKECGKSFLFADAEQERYARDGFAPPKRCRACRSARRAAKPEGATAASPGAADEAGSSSSKTQATTTKAKTKTLYEAQCGACGALTRVPFEPTDLRPVYCQTCFEYR